MLQLKARSRTHTTQTIDEIVWNPQQTALIICDMWDKHWCQGATDRVNELIPVMDTVVEAVRKQGVLVIHAPSDTMTFYAGTPQRLRATEASSCGINTDIPGYFAPGEPPLPIDDSDGGCDTGSENSYHAWSCQHPGIRMGSGDVISDSGQEVVNVLHETGRDKVLIMGVHTNMCILGRSFAIRRMLALGKSVLLIRDMTDAMYNPAKRPFVDHFTGTQLVIDHIETYLCPTIESSDLTGLSAFRFNGQQ